MSNTILNTDLILNELGYEFANRCPVLDKVDRQFDGKFEADSKEYGKTGGTINVRKPPVYSMRTGETSSGGTALREKISITTDVLTGVDLPAFSLTEKSIKVGDFEQKQDIKAAADRLAAYVEGRVLQEALSVSNSIHSSSGSITYPDILKGKAKVYDHEGGEDLAGYITATDEVSLISENKALFNPSKAISSQFEKGKVGTVGGVDLYTSNHIKNLTTGTRVGTILVDGTISTEGTTKLHIDGFTNADDTIAKSEVFTVAGVYDVHPIPKETLPYLKQWCVSADAVAASSEVDVVLTEGMYAAGVQKNCSALPIDNAAVTFLGTASKTIPQNLIWTPRAITLASVKLKMFMGITDQSRKEFKGISIRIAPVTNAENNSEYLRCDILLAVKTLQPMFACREWGAEF